MPCPILVIDDNAPYRGMLKSMLELRGYKTVLAASAQEGLKVASEMALDGILVDYDMPGVNGIEFCRHLKKHNQRIGRDIPTWIITGSLNPEVSKYAEEVGALLVLRKPFNMDELCLRMERELARRRGPART